MPNIRTAGGLRGSLAPKCSPFLEEETEVQGGHLIGPNHLVVSGQIGTQASWLLGQFAFCVCVCVHVLMKNENNQEIITVNLQFTGGVEEVC